MIKTDDARYIARFIRECAHNQTSIDPDAALERLAHVIEANERVAGGIDFVDALQGLTHNRIPYGRV